MRSLLFSFAVIIFCLSVNIVNQVEADYVAERYTPLFGWTAGEAPISASGLDEYQDSSINGTLKGYVDPVEQPKGMDSAGFFDDAVKKLSLLNMVINTLIYSTVGFHEFLHTLGRPGFEFIPYYIGVPLSILVNINHFLAVVQFIRGMSVESVA